MEKIVGCAATELSHHAVHLFKIMFVEVFQRISKRIGIDCVALLLKIFDMLRD